MGLHANVVLSQTTMLSTKRHKQEPRATHSKITLKTSKMRLLTTLRICVHGENKKLKGQATDERTLPRKQHFVSMRNGDTIDTAATYCKINVSAWIFHGDTVPRMMLYKLLSWIESVTKRSKLQTLFPTRR